MIREDIDDTGVSKEPILCSDCSAPLYTIGDVVTIRGLLQDGTQYIRYTCISCADEQFHPGEPTSIFG